MQYRNMHSAKALTLWEIIGTEYLERAMDLNQRVNEHQGQNLPNFVQQAQAQILPEIMGLMLILSKKDNEQPELREGAVGALTIIVECCDREVLDRISEGVSTVSQSSNPGERQATVLLFSCLANYGDRHEIETRFKNAFVTLFKFLEDVEMIVVKNTLSGFCTLSEFFP